MAFYKAEREENPLAKVFALKWVFESIEDEPAFYTKRMFGGMAVYLHGKMMMMMTESPGEQTYRGVDYGFEIWNGILWPTDRVHHASLQGEYPELRQHPVLGKWLYLPLTANGFEDTALELVEKIARDDERMGIFPSVKSRKSKKKIKKKSKKKASR